MKNKLFDNLDNASAELVLAVAGVNNIHATKASYNYTVTVEVKHRHRHWTGFWDDPTYSHHQETRFDQKRFDDDLVNANRILQENQQKLSVAKEAVEREIICANNLINQHDVLKSDNQQLKNSTSSLKSQLSHLSTYNLEHAIKHHQEQQNSLESKKYQDQSNLNSLSGKVQQEKHSLSTKQSENTSLRAQKQIQDEAEQKSNIALHNKISGLDQIERSKLAYAAIAGDKELFLSIIKTYGYCAEFTAYIAVSQKNIKVFDYFLNNGVDLDAIVNGDHTLAYTIFNSGDSIFIEKLFSSSQKLKITVFEAFMKKDFNTLNLLLKYDQDILQQIKEIDVCGLSAMQLAISKNDLELVSFVKANDRSYIEEKLVGYKNYLDMAVTYNNDAIIKYLGQDSEIFEYVMTLVEDNKTDMFGRVIKNLELSQKELHLFYIQASKAGKEDIANQSLSVINNIKELFVEIVKINNTEEAANLMESHPEELTLDYLQELINDSNQDMHGFCVLKEISSIFTNMDEQNLQETNITGHANDY